MGFVLAAQGDGQGSGSDTNQQANDQQIGGDKDEHGCLIAAGYSWCEAKQKCLRTWEEPCEDKIFEIFKQLKTETSINFTEPEVTELNWTVESEEGVADLKLEAYQIKADELNPAEYNKVEAYFVEQGFEPDKFNAAGSIAGGINPYRHNNFSLVCSLWAFYSDFNPSDNRYEPQTDKKDIKVTCAVLEKSGLPIISTEKLIREALAEKYNKKVSQVVVTITQETDDYARGGVQFYGLDDTLGEGGNFLAAKVNEEWQIVFDGNGSVVCEDLEEYDFPEEMIADICY